MTQLALTISRLSLLLAFPPPRLPSLVSTLSGISSSTILRRVILHYKKGLKSLMFVFSSFLVFYLFIYLSFLPFHPFFSSFFSLIFYSFPPFLFVPVFIIEKLGNPIGLVAQLPEQTIR